MNGGARTGRVPTASRRGRYQSASVTAPMIGRGVELDLPKAEAQPMATDPVEGGWPPSDLEDLKPRPGAEPAARPILEP